MIDISKLSSQYDIRVLGDADVDDILALCQGNPQFYEHTQAQPTREQIRSDMRLTPPGIESSAKYYFGLFEHQDLVAIMDLVDGYPKPEVAYIGFFMVNQAYQGRGIGAAIIDEAMAHLTETGTSSVRLAIDKANPQATHFWKKNGFLVISEVEVNGWAKLVAEKSLEQPR